MSVLVIGAYGNVGGHVLAGLRAAGVTVRGSSRTPGPGIVHVDLDEPATLPPALDGISKVFLYASPDGIDAFVEAARAAGVKHVVLLSSASVLEPAARNSPVALMHAAVEEALRASGMAWTFLRPTTFATNQLRWAAPIRAGEVLRVPFPQLRSASIHERDVAGVAVTALTGGAGHEGQAYWLTGPEALTQREHLEQIGAALGRPIEMVEVAPEDAEPRFPEFVIRSMADLLEAECVVTPTVEELTGAPARTFRQWAADHARDFS